MNPSPLADRMDAQAICERLSPLVAVSLADLGSLGAMSALQDTKPVEDDPVKIVVRNRSGRLTAMLMCSRPAAPDLVARAVMMSQKARALLGDELGRVILTPLVAGQLDGLSYVLWPWRRPLSRSKWLHRMQIMLLRKPLMRWLREATRASSSIPNSEERRGFHAALEFIVRNDRLGEEVRKTASAALARLESGQWLPRHVLAHNDLWDGNIMLQPSMGEFGVVGGRFAIIDWAGAKVKGYALYDLVRLARSLRFGPRALAEEVRVHCGLLNCDVHDAKGYLLAALGDLGMNLDRFPEDRYMKLVESCCRDLFSLGRELLWIR